MHNVFRKANFLFSNWTCVRTITIILIINISDFHYSYKSPVFSISIPITTRSHFQPPPIVLVFPNLILQRAHMHTYTSSTEYTILRFPHVSRDQLLRIRTFRFQKRGESVKKRNKQILIFEYKFKSRHVFCVIFYGQNIYTFHRWCTNRYIHHCTAYEYNIQMHFSSLPMRYFVPCAPT